MFRENITAGRGIGDRADGRQGHRADGEAGRWGDGGDGVIGGDREVWGR